MNNKNLNFDIDACWNRIGVWSQQKPAVCDKLEHIGHCRNCPLYAKAGRTLLNRPLSEDYKNELSETYSTPLASERSDTRKAFVFRAGGEWLALRSSLIQEVVDMGPIHSIPHKSSRIFRGIVNVRGKLELCVSIGGVLRIEPGKKGPVPVANPERLIVTAKAGQSVVFPVSEVLGPVQYKIDELKPLPITVSGSKAVYTKGIITIDDKFDVGLLDDKLLFRILTRNLQ